MAASASAAAPMASGGGGGGGAVWSAAFKGDFELPLPKAQLTKTGDQVLVLCLFSFVSISF